jgi:hypothetical protein
MVMRKRRRVRNRPTKKLQCEDILRSVLMIALLSNLVLYIMVIFGPG